MKKALSLNLAIVLLVLALFVPSTVALGASPPQRFSDVEAEDWFAGYVYSSVEDGLFKGTSENTFSPYAQMTRGMFVTVLGRMAGINETDYMQSDFSDVSAGTYYTPYVAWASLKGIVKGTGANRFSPNQPVTREQAVLILSRYGAAGYGTFLEIDHDTPAFTDIGSTTKEFQEVYKTLYGAAIFEGKSAKSFDPKAFLTRAEAAKVISTSNDMLHTSSEKLIDSDRLWLSYTMPSYWAGRYSFLIYDHSASEGYPGEPGAYGAHFWEEENRSEGKGELFSIYIVADGDEDIELFQDQQGNWLEGCSEIKRVKISDYRGSGEDMYLTVILQKPSEPQYDSDNPLLKKAYLRLEQDIDKVVSDIEYHIEVVTEP